MGGPEITVALGERRYRLERHWGTVPKGIRLGDMSKVAVAPNGEVYLFQRLEPPIVVVLQFRRSEHHLSFTLGERHRPGLQTPFNHPTDVAIAPNGDLYVSDGYGNSMVHQFSPEAKLKRSWGGPGSAPGQFTTPHGIWVLADGRVLVGDRENNRIQVFDGEGNYLTQWDDLYQPMDIHVDRDGVVYVVDQIPRLTALRDDGTVIGRCMAVPKEGHGISGDLEGNLFIADTMYDYIVKLVRIN